MNKTKKKSIKITNTEASKIIENRTPLGCFYFKDGDKFIGIDNRTGDAWTEEFDNEEDCLNWLKD